MSERRQAPATARSAAGDADLEAAAKSSVLSLAGAAAYGALNFAYVVVISRWLGAQGAGAFLQAIAVFNLGLVVCRLGADTGLIRFLSSYRARERVHELKATLAVGSLPPIVLSVLVGVGMWFLAPEIAATSATAGEPTRALTVYLRTFAPAFPFAVMFSVGLGASQGLGTMLPTFVFEVARPLAHVLAALAAIALAFGSVAVGLTWALPYALSLVPLVGWVMLLLRRESGGEGWRQGHEQAALPTVRLARSFWAFASPRALATAFQVSADWAPTLILGALASTREAGIYTAGTRLIFLGSLFNQALFRAIRPSFAWLLALDARDRTLALYQTATGWLIALTWPIFLVLAVHARVLLRIFGPEFVQAGRAVQVISLAMLVVTGVGPVTALLLMAGRSSWNLLNIAVSASAVIGLNFLLVPSLGMLGSGIAWAAGMTISNLLPLAQVHRYLRLHPFGEAAGRAAGASVVSYGVVGAAVTLLLAPGVSALVATLAIGSAVYGAFLWRGRTVFEFGLLHRLLRERFTRASPQQRDAPRS